MKLACIVLAGTMVLTGCASMKGSDGQYFKFPSSYAGKPGSFERTPVRDDPVRRLPKEAENALAKVGVKDIAFIAVIDKDSTIRLLAPDRVQYDRVIFNHNKPLLNVGLTSLTSISMMSYKSSRCFLWSDGSSAWAGSSERGYARFCLMYYPL